MSFSRHRLSGQFDWSFLNSINVVGDFILDINSQFYNYKESFDKKEVNVELMLFQRIHIQCIVIILLSIASIQWTVIIITHCESQLMWCSCLLSHRTRNTSQSSLTWYHNGRYWYLRAPLSPPPPPPPPLSPLSKCLEPC